VRFAGPLADGGFALAWVSRSPLDTVPSWRLQWQPFDASGRSLQPQFDLLYAEDVPSPLNVTVFVQPSGRALVAYVVSRGTDPSNPFLFENAVLARIFDGANPVGSEITVASQTFDARSRPGTFSQPLVAGFADGSFLVGWHLTGMVKPELWVQKVDADGTLVGDLVRIDSLGGLGPPREQLLTLPDGGWIATTPWRTDFPESREFTLLTQVGVRRPLDVGNSLPPGSVLVQDGRGLFIAEGPAQPGGSAVLQRFSPGGHAAGQAVDVAGLPIGAVSFPDGSAALVSDAGGTISLQRIDARGNLVGQPLATSVPTSALAGSVTGDGLVLTWAVNDADTSRVFAQLFTAGCTG
jgi:hypothetical protein